MTNFCFQYFSDLKKKSAYNCVKSFWDTDFESDLESPAPKRPMLKPDDKKENQKSKLS